MYHNNYVVCVVSVHLFNDFHFHCLQPFDVKIIKYYQFTINNIRVYVIHDLQTRFYPTKYVKQDGTYCLCICQ